MTHVDQPEVVRCSVTVYRQLGGSTKGLSTERLCTSREEGGEITIHQDAFKEALAEVSDVLHDAFDIRCQLCNERGNLSAVPRDCDEIHDLGYHHTGVYTIYPVLGTPFKVLLELCC